MFSLRLDGPIVFYFISTFRLRIAIILIKFSRVFITLIYSNVLAINNDFSVDYEFFRNNKSSRSICSQTFLSLQESTLRYTTILLFGFGDAYRIIFEVVEYNNFPHSEVFES